MVVWRSGMSHGSAGAIGSMDVVLTGTSRGLIDVAHQTAPVHALARPGLRHAPAFGAALHAARPGLRPCPGMALAASFLEFPTQLGPRQWRHDARRRAPRSRSERARARMCRSECSDLDVGRPLGTRPGLQSVPWPRDPPRNPGYAAGSVTGRVLAAGSLRRGRPGSGHARPRRRRRTVAWRAGMSPVSEAAEGAGYGRQSPTVPGDAAGAGPEGWTLPAHIVRRPQERSTRPNVPLCSTAPSGSVVLQTCPDETSIDVRTRPDDDRASTVHGSAGRVATSIVGAGPRGGKSPIGRPFTTRVTVRVVPFEIPSWGSGFAVGPGEVVVHAARPTMSKAARRAIRSFPVIDMPTPRRSNWPSRSAGLA